MNRNIKLLLDILLQQNDYLTATQLAELLNVTERSIRNYVRTLNSNQEGEPLILSSNHGYKIQRQIYDRTVDNKLYMNDTDGNILLRIAIILTNQDQFISFDDLAVALHYSVESIRSKVQLLFAKISALNIGVELNSQIFTGIQIVGSENQKRVLLEQLIPIEQISKENQIETTFNLIGVVASKEDINQQIIMLDTILSTRHITMDFIVYSKIIVHLLILQYRSKNNYEISSSEVKDGRSHDYPEYALATDILREMNYHVFPESEIITLANYLIALPINIPGGFTPKLSNNQRKNIDESLYEAEKIYQIPIFSNPQYYAQITNHIVRLLNPLEESIPIFNPYSKQTKREYFFAYSIACFLYGKLQSNFNINISESEIAYLAIHIQLVLNEEAKNPIDTLLVFKGKSVEAELYRYKLQTYFQTLKIRKVTSQFKISEFKSHKLVIVIGYDDMFTNSENVVCISRELNTENVNKIQYFIDSVSTVNLISNMDYYHIDEHSSLNAIKLLATQSGYKDLMPYFIKREEMSSTDIGNLVALPHPFLKGSETSAKVIIGINDSEIDWGSQKVRLIIIFIPAEDLKVNKSFFNEVYQRTSNLKHIRDLLSTSDKAEFIKVWNTKGSL